MDQNRTKDSNWTKDRNRTKERTLGLGVSVRDERAGAGHEVSESDGAGARSCVGEAPDPGLSYQARLGRSRSRTRQLRIRVVQSRSLLGPCPTDLNWSRAQ